jgi:hypothetical protein
LFVKSLPTTCPPNVVTGDERDRELVATSLHRWKVESLDLARTRIKAELWGATAAEADWALCEWLV